MSMDEREAAITSWLAQLDERERLANAGLLRDPSNHGLIEVNGRWMYPGRRELQPAPRPGERWKTHSRRQRVYYPALRRRRPLPRGPAVVIEVGPSVVWLQDAAGERCSIDVGELRRSWSRVGAVWLQVVEAPAP